MGQDRQAHGAFTWSELCSPDRDISRDFYGGLLGWEFEEHLMENGTYTVILVDGVPRGGMIRIDEEMQDVVPQWTQYIHVDDVDKSAKQAVALGGTLLAPPFDIPLVGRMCVAADPHGARFCMISLSDEGRRAI